MKGVVKMDSIERELRSLKGERKMNEVALMGYQHNIAEQLNSSMGEDMIEVLSGNRKVKLSFWQKLKHRIDTLLWNFHLER